MKLSEQIRVMENHYNALPILIAYIKKKAVEGDFEARQVLIKWDEERGKNGSNN